MEEEYISKWFLEPKKNQGVQELSSSADEKAHRNCEKLKEEAKWEFQRSEQDQKILCCKRIQDLSFSLEIDGDRCEKVTQIQAHCEEFQDSFRKRYPDGLALDQALPPNYKTCRTESDVKYNKQ